MAGLSATMSVARRWSWLRSFTDSWLASRRCSILMYSWLNLFTTAWERPLETAKRTRPSGPNTGRTVKRVGYS